MKKIVTIVMFLLLAVGYAACSGGSSGPTAPQQPGSVTAPPSPMPTPTPY